MRDTEALKNVNTQSKYKAKCEADKSCMALTRSQINDGRYVVPCCVHIDPMLQHTSPVCSTFCIHTWMKLWRHICEGEWGRREWLALVLGQNSIASWPIGTESASLSNMGRSVPDLFLALVWSIDRLITSGSGLNANMGTIIWTDLLCVL